MRNDIGWTMHRHPQTFPFLVTKEAFTSDQITISFKVPYFNNITEKIVTILLINGTRIPLNIIEHRKLNITNKEKPYCPKTQLFYELKETFNLRREFNRYIDFKETLQICKQIFDFLHIEYKTFENSHKVRSIELCMDFQSDLILEKSQHQESCRRILYHLVQLFDKQTPEFITKIDRFSYGNVKSISKIIAFLDNPKQAYEELREFSGHTYTVYTNQTKRISFKIYDKFSDRHGTSLVRDFSLVRFEVGFFHYETDLDIINNLAQFTLKAIAKAKEYTKANKKRLLFKQMRISLSEMIQNNPKVVL